MRTWGATLLFIGILSFVLPIIGFQFNLISIFGEENQTTVALVACVVGAGLMMANSVKERLTSRGETSEPAPASQIPQTPTSTASVPPPPRAVGERVVYCTACGTAANPGNRFCRSCGKPIQTA